jgi:AcrR family transcriptional regulator
MKEKSILQISVNEICKTADIGRTTFYAHYNDQYDLLRQMQEEALSGLQSISKRHQNTAMDKSGRTALLQELLQYIADNKSSIQVLLSDNGDPVFQRKYFSYSAERMRQLKKSAGDKSPDSKLLMYQARFLAGGFHTLIQDWIENGMDTPVPEMAALLLKLSHSVFM